MADQCIVCLENLDVESANAAPLLPSAAGGTGTSLSEPYGASTLATADHIEPAGLHKPDITTGTGKQLATLRNDYVARIEVCGHMLHDTCLREWSTQANSCPICRQAFHCVDVYDKVGGSLISSYKVNDKKQVAEFDLQAWVNENPDEREEEQRPCPVCNLADREEVLLLCDGCDAPYHTHCLGLDSVPAGHWFCMECSHAFEFNSAEPDGEAFEEHRDLADNGDDGAESVQEGARRTYYFPRTRASMRRVRRRAHSDEWSGAWGQIAGHIFDALDLDLDLDYQDDDDDTAAWQNYRRSQQRRAQETREYQQWQQRLSIASRLGARDVFENHLPTTVSRVPRVIPAQRAPVQESRDERRAWGALEKARQSQSLGTGTGNSRKRKSRSSTAEPQPQEEPERKLKRPRARRLPAQNGESSSSSAKPSSPNCQTFRRGSGSALDARSPRSNAAPSFLNSLLREVENGTPSEEDSNREFLIPFAGGNGGNGGNDGSPATSPVVSGYSSPRASSITPPPPQQSRPTSPSSTLSSLIEPIYPRANYSPQRPSRTKLGTARSCSPDSSDSDTRTTRLELRQPQPRRLAQQVKLIRTEPSQQARGSSPLPLETKEDISRIVRGALRPHWKSAQLTEEQYAAINRSVSHKLYKVAAPVAIDDRVKRTWEEIATKEVERAVADLKA